ncbi:MAG: S-methyl-5-thioribose-1-phosphate isomerase [Planctomycetes bacterium]|nr:S-methyl-5-thioribose-1-phosphate isomerase [Planctomycetota bacterium]
MPVSTIEWHGGVDGICRIIEQTLLPTELKYVDLADQRQMWDAIKRLAVRGAPAIGIAGAFGVVLGFKDSKATTPAEFDRDLEAITKVAQGLRTMPLQAARERLLAEAQTILTEDKAICRKLGEIGAPLVPQGRSALTHCNAGGLATADYGTALAVFFRAKELGKRFHVYVDETRPLLQGSRLTAWELQHEGIDSTLICDNMAAMVMRDKDVGAVFVGADRIARNGDTANKIGTYGVSVLAKAHGIPFYVVAPVSTFDLTIPDGKHIPIEEREDKEVTEGFGKRTAPTGVRVFNPAFDVTPHANIAGIVTELGLIERPDAERVPAFFERHRR